jgi:16S rRNA (uracil1498-N3)-methyltransferase
VVDDFGLVSMTRRRWIADEVSGNHAALTGSHAEHLSRVLRARVGQEFDIATDLRVHHGWIVSITPGRVEFELGEEVSAIAMPKVTLALSIFKFDRMEWAIEKCTELGVARVVPVISHRTEPRLAAAAAQRRERWQRIAGQASEQSRRSSPPEISLAVKLREALALPGNPRIVLAENQEEIMLKDALGPVFSGTEVTLAIGPEGGWTEPELELFRQTNWTMASLGGTIVRAETAAIAATAIVFSELY